MDKYLRYENLAVRNESENRIVEDVYDAERRAGLVGKTITESREITEQDRHLIFKFAENGLLRGLSKTRAIFYPSRFWNIARLVDKNFERMSKKDIEQPVRETQKKGIAPRTASDHPTAIKTLRKWVEKAGDTYPEKVRWIKAFRRNGACRLPEELLSREDLERLVYAVGHATGSSVFDAPLVVEKALFAMKGSHDSLQA